MGAALAAVKLHIPVAHIEAGCRAYDMSIAEEVNRLVTDSVSSLLFTASLRHWTNLISERQLGKSYNVGDVLLDILVMHFPHIEKVKTLDNLGISQPYYVATIHRNWNVDDPATFESILKALSKSPIPVVYPIHPRSRKMLQINHLEKYIGKNICIIDPVSYYDMINLMRFSNAVITDSGGVQREAFYLHKLCIALKNSTPEWQELVDCEATVLAGTKDTDILKILKDPPEFPKRYPVPYGNATASDQIAEIIGEYIG
jgi:UDP-N-acetylglucosamine 2-epimerase